MLEFFKNPDACTQLRKKGIILLQFLQAPGTELTFLQMRRTGNTPQYGHLLIAVKFQVRFAVMFHVTVPPDLQ